MTPTADLDPDAGLFGDDGRWEPCDITVPVGWGYEDQRGDYELGSGWNETIRDIPVFPRYQIHVVLSQ